MKKTDNDEIVSAYATLSPGFTKRTDTWLVLKNFILLVAVCFVHSSSAQDMGLKAYVIAGNDSATALGDGGPATDAMLWSTEGIWMDASCNIYFSDLGNNRIRKIDGTTQRISTIAGNGLPAFSGDGGLATDASIYSPYGLWADDTGNVYFADATNNRVRRIDAASHVISTFAGGGSIFAEGVAATNTRIYQPRNVYGDKKGNFYITETGRVRKIDNSGIIRTIAGNGVSGLSGDGGPATNAQLSAGVDGMALNEEGDLYLADRGNSRIRKLALSTGFISTVAGTIYGFSGDGGAAIDAQLSGPISIFVDGYNDLVIADNQNQRIRVVDHNTGIIRTIAGVGFPGNPIDGAQAFSSKLHPEFIYIDLNGNIYMTDFGYNTVVKLTNYFSGLKACGSTCGVSKVAVENSLRSNDPIIAPNPATTLVQITGIEDQVSEILLVDITGKIITRIKKENDQAFLNVKEIARGFYFLVFVNNYRHAVRNMKLIIN